ncbi:hypothetical protein PRIEUP_LOCUS23 [Pristimantis euphronides]
MGLFEQEVDLAGRGEVHFYKRYIDDLLIIWQGPSASLTTFIEDLNRNDLGLEFTSTFSSSDIIYLDLHFFIQNNMIKTKT